MDGKEIGGRKGEDKQGYWKRDGRESVGRRDEGDWRWSEELGEAGRREAGGGEEGKRRKGKESKIPSHRRKDGLSHFSFRNKACGAAFRLDRLLSVAGYCSLHAVDTK